MTLRLKALLTALTACTAVIAGTASGDVIITNGDLEGTEFYSSGTTEGVGSLINADYVTNGDGWYFSEWSHPADGGPMGTGDAYAAHGGGKIRGLMNILTDDKTTTGSVTMSVDLLASAGKSFRVKVWGINDSDGGTPGIQWDGYFDLSGPSGNPDGLDLRNIGQNTSAAVSYTGTNITQLLSTTVSISGSAWQQGNEFTFDLGGTGYDQIGVGFVVDSTGSAIGVDNLQIVPEPAAIALIGVGVGSLILARRFRWKA